MRLQRRLGSARALSNGEHSLCRALADQAGKKIQNEDANKLNLILGARTFGFQELHDIGARQIVTIFVKSLSLFENNVYLVEVV